MSKNTANIKPPEDSRTQPQYCPYPVLMMGSTSAGLFPWIINLRYVFKEVHGGFNQVFDYNNIEEYSTTDTARNC